MKFKIMKDLESGRYYVHVRLKDLTDDDVEKSKKFGFPLLKLRIGDGRTLNIRIDRINTFSGFGFYDQKEADEYVTDIKNQINIVKKEWEAKKDTWSVEETL